MPSPLPPTAPPHASLRADDLSELIAGIPGLLGFPPTDSLVLVTFTVTDRLCLGATLRADLPARGDIPDIVDLVCTAAMNNDAVAATAVVVGGGSADPPATLPHRALIETISDVLHDDGIVLMHSAWVAATEQGATWWCYEDECTGQVADPRASALAAAAAEAGLVTFASRAEMAALLAPDADELLDRRAELLDACLDRGAEPYGDTELERDRRLVCDAIDAAAESTEPPELDDRQIVRLANALSTPNVRDDCLAVALTERAVAAERLWTALIRGTPAPERAEPACLLAVSAYLRGEGVLAGMAMDAALDADPGHQLVEQLRQTLDYGMPPDKLRDLLSRSIKEATHPTTRTDDP